MTTILVPAHFHAALQERLSNEDVHLEAYDAEGIPANAVQADAMFRWWLSEEAGDRLINEHEGMRWIHSGSAGIDHIVTPAFRARSITLTNSSGVHAPSIAEWVVAAMLSQEKGLDVMRKQQRDHLWEKVERPELSSRTVVIIGAGSIATAIASRLRPFGCRLVSVRRSATEHPAFDEVLPSSMLLDAASRADWLIVAVPLSADTRSLVDANIFSVMKTGARFVNVARGEIVDEMALIGALREGRLAGAVLDVLQEEPPPPDHPLWDLPNVVLLPHTTWRSPEVKERQLELFVENVRRFVSGRDLRNVVDVARGY